jgi:enediyne biosynthesis protein E4
VFSDITDQLGIDFVHQAGLSDEKQLPETMGAGAALCDLDGDGFLDLYLVQSGPLPVGGARNRVAPNQLWLGDGQGGFRDVTATSGDAAHRGYGMGVACADVNGDEHLDLYVTNLGPDVLLLGDGTGSFQDATESAGIADSRWTAGASFFDADADGDQDLYVTAYLDYDLEDPAYCGERKPGWRSYCHPDRYSGIQDRFWRNLGDGTFEDATISAGLADSHGKGLGVCASDFDGDGDLDLYVANDSVENRLWINSGEGTFTDGTLLAGTGVNGMGLTEAGMGLATGDLDGDGRIDIYVTNFDDESNTLYHNDGDGMFTDITASAGLEAPSRLPVGFGVIAADLDGDLDLDLAVANGHIIDNIQLYNDGKSWAQEALLFQNDGRGHFRDVSSESGALAQTPRVGRGLYAGDLDMDGDLDLVTTENNGRLRVLRNDGPGENPVVLHGLPPQSLVRFHLASGQVLTREVGPQVSYLGATSAIARCNSSEVNKIEITTPGGLTSVHPTPVSPGRYRAGLKAGALSLQSIP